MEFYGSTHNHTDKSNFRLRDSTNQLKTLCWYAAKELKHDFIAITDHETIATAIECQDVEAEIRKEFPNFKIIRGNEIYLCRDDLSKETVESNEKYYHWILLAKDEIGHEQIRKLSSRAWSHAFETKRMTRVPTYYSDLIEIIGSNPGHVIMQTSCLGSKPSQLLLDYNINPSEEKWQYIKDWLTNIAKICGKENFFLETQPSFSEEQIAVNCLYKKLSNELNIPVVISLDAHYLKKEDEAIHHAFLTSQDGERETKSFYASTYMMSREEIHSYMDESIGKDTVSEWMNNTKLVYDMCEDYDLTKPTRIVYLPKTIDVITEEEFDSFKDKIKELEYFHKSPYKENVHLAAAIVRRIINEPEEFDNQMTYEAIDDNLKAVRLASEKMNTQWSAYLLNLRDYVNIIWNEGNSFTGPSRGCFYPKEKVLMYNGTEKAIEDIKVGDKVINHNGNINEVKRVYRYDIEEECYIIKGKGKEPIHCTNNHKFYVKKCKPCVNDTYKYHWCKETCRKSGRCEYEKTHEVGFFPANELEVGDMLAYPKPKLPEMKIAFVDLKDYLQKDNEYSFFDENTVGYYVGNNRIIKGKELPRFIPVDEELAYVCGVFIGDGWTKTAGESELGFAFHSENKKDLDSLERCENFFLSLGLNVVKMKHKEKKIIQMRVYSKVLHSFFRQNFGKDTYEKHIPDWLITSNQKITKALLLGLMASDGHYDKDKICYDTVNKDLVKQVQMMWASIGIFGNYNIRVHKKENWHDSYKWCASGKQLEKLTTDFPLINISQKRFSRQDFLEDDDCFYTIIEEIKTEPYKGYVYDLNVENIHSYVINGTSVHNSGTGFLLLYMLKVTQINPLRETTRTYSFRFLNPERVSPLD